MLTGDFHLQESLSSVILQQNQFVNQAVAEGQYGSQAKKELLDFLATVTKSNNISKIAQEFQPISQAMTPWDFIVVLKINCSFCYETSIDYVDKDALYYLLLLLSVYRLLFPFLCLGVLPTMP